MGKGQIAVTGFILSIVLVIVVFTLFFTQYGTLLIGRSEYADIKGDSEHASGLLMSEGYPSNWEDLELGKVKKLGLLDDDRLSLKKLEEFSKINYSMTKRLLGIRFDYIFFIEREDGEVQEFSSISRDFFGWNGYLFDGNGAAPLRVFFAAVKENAEHIAKNEKFVKVDSALSALVGKSEVKLIVYTWNPVDFVLEGPECWDGINNDPWEDMLIDYDPSKFKGDPGCLNITDNNESNPPFELSCLYRNGSCSASEQEIIRLSDDAQYSQHAAFGDDPLYPNGICCEYANYINISTASDCDTAADTILLVRLDKENGANLQQNNYSDYVNKICIKGIGRNISCNYQDGSCLAGYEIVFSMSSQTNAHIGNSSDYDRKVCCKYD